MKKRLIAVILPLTLLLCICIFWDPILDFLPIDQSGWRIEEGNRYYLDEDGDPVSGWQEIDGCKYYFDEAAKTPHTGWLSLENKQYCFDSEGCLITSCWIPDAVGPVYVGPEGHTLSGWLEESGARYYLDAQGRALTGWQELENTRFYFGENGAAVSGWQTLEGRNYYFNNDGSIFTGWLELEGQRHFLSGSGAAVPGWADTDLGRFYLDGWGVPQTGLVQTEEGTFFLTETGTPYTGWLVEEESRRYFDETGKLCTGWLELEGVRYYLKEDGTAAVGKLVIDEQACFFTSTGANFILVNRWNPLPADFTVDLVTAAGIPSAAECKEPLEEMLQACLAAGHRPWIASSYRSIQEQTANLDRQIENWLAAGYSRDKAYQTAIQIVAIPGTSEHHLGLAFDIVDSGYRKLDHTQANTSTQKWLMENSWKYGFIMRYPQGETAITGIIYEPWHYRYVGKELAKELYELGITLEEYIDRLTNDGTTCGGQLKTE